MPDSSRAIPDAPGTEKRELRFLGPGDPDHLDASSLYVLRPAQCLRLVSRQLFAYPAAADLSFERSVFVPRPDVALEIPSEANGGLSSDRRTYRIRLRPGVMWSSTPPRELVAEDFLRGIKRIADPTLGRAARECFLHYFTSTVEGMQDYVDRFDEARNGKRMSPVDLERLREEVDIRGIQARGRTLVIRLERPANDFLNLLAMGIASAIPEEFRGEAGRQADFARYAISSGPFRVASCTPEGEMLLEQNPVWRKSADPIRARAVGTVRLQRQVDDTRFSARGRDTGTSDVAWPIGVASWGDLKHDTSEFERKYPAFALNPYVVFNLRSANASRAVQRLEVRRAIAYAIDRVSIGRIFAELDGVSTRPLHSVLPPGSDGHREFNLYPTSGDRGDPTRARELLASAGYPDGLTLTAAIRSVGLHLRIFRSIEHDLKRCGIRLHLHEYEGPDYYRALLGRSEDTESWDVAEPGWTPDWWGNNGRAMLMPLFRTRDGAPSANYGFYSNPIVDELIERALGEPEPAMAELFWHEADVAIMKDLPVIPLLAFACHACVARSGAAGWGTWSPELSMERESSR